MALNFYDVMGGRLKAAQARSVDQDTRSKQIANASSWMDLQRKIRMKPAVDNQIQTAEIQSEAALERAQARAELLDEQPNVVKDQERMILDMESDDIKRKQIMGDLGQIAQFGQQPITGGNKEQFFQQLEEAGVDVESYGYKRDMSAPQIGILNQVNRDRFINAQKHLQAKDLLDVQQQNTLDRDQKQQAYAMQQNLQKFTFDMALQREQLNSEERIRALMSAGAPDIPQDVFVWEDEKQFGDTFLGAMQARFPNAEWVDDDETLNKLSKHAYKMTTQRGNEAYRNWKAGQGPIPQTREAYFDEVINEDLVSNISLDGTYYDDPNAEALQESREKFSKDFLSNPKNRELMEQFLAQERAAGNEVSVDEFIQMVYGNPIYRGYTPADPFQTGTGVDSNIPVPMGGPQGEIDPQTRKPLPYTTGRF